MAAARRPLAGVRGPADGADRLARRDGVLGANVGPRRAPGGRSTRLGERPRAVPPVLASRAVRDVLRELLGRRARRPRAVGVGAPPGAAARRGAARGARAGPRLRLGPLRRRRCATRAPTPSGSRSPRRRSSAPAAIAPGADLRLLEPDGSLPLEHGSVDLVWCSEVLEHVADGGAPAARGRGACCAAAGGCWSPCRSTAASRPPRSRSRASTPTSTRRASTCASTPAPRSPRRCGRPGFEPTSIDDRRRASRCCASRSSRARTAA